MFSKFLNPGLCRRAGCNAAGWAVALCLTLLAGVPVRAQVSDGGIDFLDNARQWMDQAVSGSHPAGASALRMEVSLGELDRRLRLAPCARVEPYIPVGTRLWGKTRLGLRCVEGASKWNVFLPVTIKAYGPAWVIKGNVAAGEALSDADAIETEVDWAEESSPIVANPAQWVGQVATRSLTTGQALRQVMIRPAQVFQAGTQVRVVAQGVGFEVTSDAQALSAGVVGQPTRVRMDSGRIMTGIVMDKRTVRLEI